ncbi:aromatic/alkene monooxygenase hydroxylase subunit beta [Kribbella sp. WER1]
MTATQESPKTERSVPKPVFTDAEAGAREFPDSTLRHYNYYKPQKRKQSHYEDVTVDVQPDPRHYLTQGWLYGFADGRGGYPLDWTVLKAWGSDKPSPLRGPGSGGMIVKEWPATGWHEFRDPNEEWELTLYRYNSNVVRQVTQNVEAAKATKAFEQWNPNWVRFVEQHVGAWMHVDHGLGLYLYANANRRAPTNMHNNAISVNSMHRIRAAQDLALYNLTLSEEIPGFDGSAHLETWNHDPAWQGVRELAESLTAIDDWCEAIFAANIVFEPLVGELFRSQLVQQAAPRNGDFVTPTVIGAAEYDFAERDLRYTTAMFELLTEDKEFAAHNKAIMNGWASTWTAKALAAARTLQPLWSQPDAKPPRFEDGLDRVKSRFSGIVIALGLEEPKELAQ